MKKNIILVILAGLLTIFTWKNFAMVSGNNVIFVFIFVASIITMKQILKNINKRKIIVTSVVSVLFALAEIVGDSINADYTLNNLMNTRTLIYFFGYFVISIIITNVIFDIFEYFKNLKQKELNIIKNSKINDILSNSKIQFIICVILILVAWLPYFLRYYPGIVTSDSCHQIEMAIGKAELTNHHPVAHTGIIAICIKLGQMIFNNINTGIALYSLLSMFIIAIFDAFVLKYLREKAVPKFIRVIVLLYYMLYPVNAIYSITMWKDILLSGVFPLLIIIYRELIFNTEEFFKKKINIISYIIISLLTILFKHNGLYAIILSMPFILIFLRKYWKKTVPLFSGVVILYLLSNTLIYDVLNIKKGSVAEMLSIPTQQIARIEKNYREELGEETLQTINKFFIKENIGDYYTANFSDPVKFKFKAEYFNNNKLEFIKLWANLFIKYPKDYIESVLSNSYGYYYVEARNWTVATETRDDPDNIMGIVQQPKIEGKLVDWATQIIDKRDIPLVSMGFSIGAAFWLIVTCLAYKIYIKEYKNILIYLPIFILWLTMIASPVFCEFRYAYPMFTTLPLYASLNFIGKGEKINE